MGRTGDLIYPPGPRMHLVAYMSPSSDRDSLEPKIVSCHPGGDKPRKLGGVGRSKIYCLKLSPKNSHIVNDR